MADLVGNVIHYFDKIDVAVIKLKKPLKVGDSIKFVKGEIEFEQTVNSMQIDKKPVTEGKKGQEIAIKTNEKIKKGWEVFTAD